MKKLLFIISITCSSIGLAQFGNLSTSIDANIGVNGITLPTRNNTIIQGSTSASEEFTPKNMIVAGAQLGGTGHLIQCDFFDVNLFGQYNLGWMFTDSYKSYDYGFNLKIGVPLAKLVFGKANSFRKTVGYYFNPTGAQTYTEKLSYSVYDSIRQTAIGARFDFNSAYIEIHYLTEKFLDLSKEDDSLVSAIGGRLIIGTDEWNLNAEVIYDHPSRGYRYVALSAVPSDITYHGIYGKLTFTKVIAWRKEW